MTTPLFFAFKSSSAIGSGIEQAAERGFSFVPGAVSQDVLDEILAETETLSFETDEQVFRAGSANRVEQHLEKCNVSVLDERIPTVKLVAEGLAQQARFRRHYAALRNWMPNEAGFQLYKEGHHITAHRDSAKDLFLGATVTLRGSAVVKMYRTIDNPIDYRPNNLQQLDTHTTQPGDIMFLRANGLANGVQVPHEVLPPIADERLTLNLRMRAAGDVRLTAG